MCVSRRVAAGMMILALDGSTEALSVAVLDTRRPADAHAHFEIAPRAHARRLLPEAQRLLDEAGLALADIDGFAFGRGPGAFTGLRVTAGLIQGLASGTDRPVVPVSTLAALAARCFALDCATRVRVVQDARMGEIYAADFERGEHGPVPISAERVIRPAALVPAADDMARAGNGWALVASVRGQDRSAFRISVDYPHAMDIARLAAPVLARGDGVPAARAVPTYVRDDVARKPS